MEIYLIIIKAVNQILNQAGFINLVINEQIKEYKLKQHDKAFFTKVVYGTVENKIYLDYQLEPYVKTKLPKDVKNILRIGVYSINSLDVSNHYVINTLVEITKNLYPEYDKMVNAILRNVVRNGKRGLPSDDIDKYLSVKYSYPINLVHFLRLQYPDQIEQILQPTNETYNIYRINTLKTTSDDLAKVLNFPYEIISNALITKVSLNNTIPFLKGEIVYQDYSSQRVAEVLNPKKDSMVLDMCSAPGSKAFYLSTIMENTGEVWCCDIYEHKIKLINDEAKRLGVTNIKTICTDSTTHQFDCLFDYVLLDAPCSGLGVMKHKCDLKYHFNFGDLKDIIVLQKALLGKAAKVLKMGGVLVYSTCTINKQENEEMMKYFLKKHKEFTMIEMHSFLPSDKCDGFFICKLQKVE